MDLALTMDRESDQGARILQIATIAAGGGAFETASKGYQHLVKKGPQAPGIRPPVSGSWKRDAIIYFQATQDHRSFRTWKMITRHCFRKWGKMTKRPQS